MKRTPLHLLAPVGLAACFGDTSCFVAGTLVATPSGPIPIDALVSGDLVWSFSLDRGKKVARPVRAIMRSTASEVRIIRAGASVIAGVTREHPFYDMERRAYRPVRDLAPGDVVGAMIENGISSCTIEHIAAKEVTVPAIRVINLTIDGPEANYFADGILVHNKSYAIVHCSPPAVTIVEHRVGTDDPQPGDYEVRWSEPPSGDPDMRIDRVIGPGEYERRPNMRVPIGPTLYRVSLTTAEPGDYRVIVNGGVVRDNGSCLVAETLAFTIAAK